MTLPPIVPWTLVAWEPTIADASASAVKPLADDAVGRDLLVRDERAEAQPPLRRSDAAQLLDPVDRDDGLRQRRLALTRADDEVGAAGDGTRAAGQRRERLVEAPGRDEGRHQLACSAAAAPDPLGRHRELAHARAHDLRDRVRNRSRSGHGRRLADALGALRAAVRGRRLDPGDVDARSVGCGHELVVEKVRVPLAAVLVEQGGLEERLPDAHDDAAEDLAVAPIRLMITPESCAAATWQHAHDARLAVDLDAGGVGEDLRLEEGLHPEPAEAALSLAGRVLRDGPEPLPRSGPPSPASSAISTARAGEPTTWTRPPTSSRSSRATSSFSAARSSSCSRTSIAAATTARPLFIVVCEPEEPASQGPASVSW